MKIAIETGPLESGHKVRGIGVHTSELISALKTLKIKDFDILDVGFAGEDLSKYDLVHFQDFRLFFQSLPKKKPSNKVVVTIHDTIPLIYPDKYPPGIGGKINFIKNIKRLRYVDGIITVSETSKKDICRFLGVSPKKVYVTHNAQKEIFKVIKDKSSLRKVKEKYELPDSFILYVGDMNYNKNIDSLIKACQNLHKNLVICGKQALEIDGLGLGIDVLGGPMDWIRFLFNIPHPENVHYGQLSKMFSKHDLVKRLGFVPDADLVKIYNLANIYVQPSFYEGFGLPILEALACGTPVLASRINAHKEIAGSNVEYFDPKKEDDLEKKLKKKIVKKEYIDLDKYSWRKTALETIKIYKEILGIKSN